MLPYGFVITDAGRSLMAGWSSGQTIPSLSLAKIMVGTGVPAAGTTADDLKKYTDLITPVAQATSTVPQY